MNANRLSKLFTIAVAQLLSQNFEIKEHRETNTIIQSTMLSGQKAFVLLCLLMGLVLVSITLRHKVSSYGIIGDPQSTSTAKLLDVKYIDLYNQLVVLTAFSDNHFVEARDMIASIQTCLPDKKIIVYDLGLNSENKNEVCKYCNVELRSFPFENYTQHHMRNLRTYAWKPVIVKLVSREYNVIMYGDASLRMKSCNMNRALEHLLNEFPFLGLNPISFRAIEFTHDGMIEYLHYPEHRKDIAQLQTLEASCFLMRVNSVMQEKVVEPWLDCALHQECIAPKGSTKNYCSFTRVHDGHYVGCHRYDQSALNLILAREFGVDGALKGSKRSITQPIWKVVKKKTNDYSLSYCV